MARTERSLRIKRRLQGVAFLVVVFLLLALTVAIYNKALPGQGGDTVTLHVDRIGNQLVVPADVKLDGIIVGRVSDARTDGEHTTLTMKIDDSRMKDIPSDVVARILPKTLFGEKYVQLVTQPGAAVTDHLRPGATISEDQSSTAIELQTVFSHLVPLLQTLKPAELSIALSNLADALRDRGEALGKNLELVNTYFTKFNQDLPNFNHDISAFADLASNYADATPDLLATLHNFADNARTFTVKKDTYAQFLIGTQGFAREATTVFGDNANRLITLANVSKPVLDMYATYSDVLECLPNGLAIYDRTRLEQTFGAGPFLHITLTPVGDRGAYKPTDAPRKSDLLNSQPPPGNDNNCYGLPYNGDTHIQSVNDNLFRFPGPHPDGNYKCAGYQNNPGYFTCPDGAGNTNPVGTPASRQDAGSVAEQQLLSNLFGPITGQSSAAGLEDLLLGPMLRGMNVTVTA
ncbi:MAG: phospholipid/cholesterol/gamma-HCH transport system substrate-binding protein [Frankiaceae bacterium]|jgi:virulence factor Mce-like protein|nr:phospholipid/cholesterol/gamma-HCH transport system substrate-binding protein [Frankiaceae bacterium]